MKPDAENAVGGLLLSLLACPETQQSLTLAAPELIEQINQRIQAGQIVRHDGTRLRVALEGGLLRADQACLYPIEEGIPNLLVSDRIDLAPSND